MQELQKAKLLWISSKLWSRCLVLLFQGILVFIGYSHGIPWWMTISNPFGLLLWNLGGCIEATSHQISLNRWPSKSEGSKRIMLVHNAPHVVKWLANWRHVCISTFGKFRCSLIFDYSFGFLTIETRARGMLGAVGWRSFSTKHIHISMQARVD